MKTILIADDSVFMQKFLTNVIEQQNNYKVSLLANNGQEAIEQYKKEKPDIVLLDIVMPVKDGLSALKEILSYDEEAKVIMCSALGTKNHMIETINLGAKDFIVKPFFHHLIETLNKVNAYE